MNTQESIVKTQELTAIEMLDCVLEKLTQGTLKNVKFTKPIHIEIANDNDSLRTRISTLHYDECSVISINGKLWLLALGITSPNYLGDIVDKSDIIALPTNVGKLDDIKIGSRTLDEKLEEMFRRQISMYFHNSLLVGTTSGCIGLTKKGVFGKPILKYLNAEGYLFIRGSVESGGLIDANLVYDYIRAYDQDLVKAFTKAIVLTLIENNK